MSEAVQFLDVEFVLNTWGSHSYMFEPAGKSGESPCRLLASRSMLRKASALFRSWHRSRRPDYDSSQLHRIARSFAGLLICSLKLTDIVSKQTPVCFLQGLFISC